MKAIIFVISILIFSKCSSNIEESVVISQGFSENPDESRKAFKVTSNLDFYFCIEKTEPKIYDYYHTKIEREKWIEIKTAIEKLIQANKKKPFDLIVDLPISEIEYNKNGSIIKIDSITIRPSDDFKVLVNILESLNKNQGKKIKYYPFTSKILTEDLSVPPPIK